MKQTKRPGLRKGNPQEIRRTNWLGLAQGGGTKKLPQTQHHVYGKREGKNRKPHSRATLWGEAKAG